MIIMQMAREIHADNVAAGWWSDLATGQPILTTRNRPEMLMLVVSELSEANAGLRTGCLDDKLPLLPMFPVELGDAAIRLLDLIGAEAAVHGELFGTDTLHGVMLDTFSEVTDLMSVVDFVSAAMEHYRKGRITEYRVQLNATLAAVFLVAERYNYSVPWMLDVVQQKRRFNAQRADHKVENRRAAGGKAF